MPRRLLSVVVVLGACMSAHAGGAQHGMDLDSADVLDLAQRPASTGKPLAFGTLDAATAAAILAAPTIAWEPPPLKFSADEYGCKTPACWKEREAKLIAAADGTVKRTAQKLEIVSGSTSPPVFVDWKSPATKTADGDEETHWYLGRLPGSGYHRVEVQFGHDAPGSFLINSRNGKAAFVHNCADLAAPAPDGLRLVTFNTEFPPLALRVAALDAAGPRVELVCTAAADDEHTQAQFKGWRGADVFDVVIQTGERRVPVRFVHAAQGWSIAAGAAAPGIVCSAGK